MTVDMQSVRGFVRRHAWAGVVAALFAAVGYLSFVRLDNTCFWDDEAHVGIIARNYLATGKFTGWDGRNLLAFRDGRLLDDDLNTINPPLEYLLTAGSFRLLGQSTWAGRFPFVVAGLMSLAVFGIIVRRDFRDQPALGLYALATLGLSVVFLLNTRQCRYYSIGLLFALLSYDAYRRCLATAKLAWYLVFSAAVVGLFYSNFLFWGAFAGALVVVHLVFHRRELKRKDLWKLVLAIALVIAATVPYAIEHRIWHRPDIESEELWYHRKPLLLWLNVQALDTLGLPWMMAAALTVILVFTRRTDKNVRRFLEFACLGVGYTVFVAMISPQSGGAMFADTRYLLPAVPFLAALVAAVVHFVHRREKFLAMALFLLVVTTNLFSAKPWKWKFSWLLPAYIHEVHHDYPTVYSEVTAYLRQNAQQDDSVFAWPTHNSFPIMFYLGDKVRLCGLIDFQTTLPMEKVEALERTGAPLQVNRHFPVWIVFFGVHSGSEKFLPFFSRTHAQDGKSVRMDYGMARLLNVFWFDTSRPELHLHNFGPQVDFNLYSNGVCIFKGYLVPAEAPSPQTHSSQPQTPRLPSPPSRPVTTRPGAEESSL
jgi:4-amino-4-deoxy-L-arabinose transferase-like glycosyltransferase